MSDGGDVPALQAIYPPTTAVPPPPPPGTGRVVRPRHLQLAGFLAGVAWYFCARTLALSASKGIAVRFDIPDIQPILNGIFVVFLVILGIALLAGIERRRAPLRLTLGLPARRTSTTEWAQGAAIGWGLAVVSVLPMLLARALQVRLWTVPRAWELALLNLLVLALLTLANALGIYGYAFQRLIDGAGKTRATLIVVLLSGVYAAFTGDVGGSFSLRVLVTMLASLVLCLCWLRTHGLWLLWGLHFAWLAAIGVLFGLPIGDSRSVATLIQSETAGPLWLTGGDFGPGAGLFTALFLIAAIPLLLKLTSDYAWDYTHPPIIPAGYEVDVPPPAAHTAMEQAPPPRPAPLVQILPITSPPPPESPEK